MKGRALVSIPAVVVSVSLAAVVAAGAPARAAVRPASAHASHRAALTTTTIRITTHNSVFLFSAKTAKRGVVIFKIHNTSEFRHDFSIDGHTTKLITTGQSTTLRVTFLRKGRYPWRCTFDHHASFGERGVFTIT